MGMKIITPQIRPAPLAAPQPVAPPASVALQIESVVFHGFSHAEGHRASAALQQELTRLISVHGLPEFSDNTAWHIDAGPIRASAARPELTGVRAARAIHGGLRA
jgi:hypothetical protein